jgi:MFS-type transporter involved in bile tolerance (Atg22 family)
MTTKETSACMARPTLAERLSALDQPDHATDASAMWSSVRPILVIGRMLMVGLIIAIGEIFDDVRMAGLTIGVWALILGIPLFLFISAIITYVDRLVNGEEETPV